jgi:arylsulfatase A-like enzyme
LAKPKNVILIVADSLRYDSVYRGEGPGVPYLEKNGIQFTGVRSAGCWTLPATSSMFTGLMSHKHGATSQSRWLKDEIPSLPEKMKAAGYHTIQVTANMVTTDIFNLSKGFDETYKTWNLAESKHQFLLRAVLALNRPRIRRMVLKPKDIVFEKLSEDLRQGIIWAQKTSHTAFAKARERIEELNAKGQPVFMFINLMEPHYPYHIADKFTLMSKDLRGKIHEWMVLYHFLSQTFIKNENGGPITQADLDVLRQKQQLSWKLIRDDIDNFSKEYHSAGNNLVIFCSDHGDNFGEQNWQYHFGNVTEAGNRVPYFWLDHENPRCELKTHNVSARFMYNDILRACGIPAGDETMLEERFDNFPLIESIWYDNEGKTLPKYQYNQVAFIEGDKRFALRAGNWMYAPVKGDGKEPVFEYVQKNFNPLEELNLPADRKKYLEQTVDGFKAFSEQLSAKKGTKNGLVS